LAGGLTALTATGSAGAKPDDGAADRPGLLQQLRADADGSVTVTGEDATNRLGFIRAGSNGDLMPDNGARSAAKADAFLADYAPLLGAPADQLVRQSVSHDDYGSTVTYTQHYKGLPVFGSMVLAHLDSGGDLTSVNGVGVPNLDLSVSPQFSKQAAAHRAIQIVRADPPGGKKTDTSGIKAASNRLIVYRDGLVRGVPGDSELAWQVEVTNRKNIRDMVFVSATSGKAVNRYSMVDDALHRVVYERTHTPAAKVWEEGDPFPGALNVDQQNIVRGSGEAYWFFSNVFGRDSYDAAGHIMETVNNDPRIACPNANWNGITTNYCNGVTADDVVAHEWGHAYTEFTHGLIYQWQPGALNESYSDIWGETVDLINGRMDEDEGDITAKRQDGVCSSHSPARPLLTINSPSTIAKDCATGGAAFGPQLSGTGVTQDLVLGLDADEDGDNDPNPFDLEGSKYDGCSPFTNAADLAGKIVMVNRGLCGFEVKARNIDAAGGVGAVIANRDPIPITMSGDALPDPSIPSVSIGRDDRTTIANAIEGSGATVNVTMKDAGGDREDSFRWLIGEDATAFGGAIRDMWTPTCHGDPGKVSDAEYFCSTDDGGGVHSNSGVPNHGYALLVDGGDYNGVTVPGIGLTKAAAIYFRAMTAYQTPTTKFADHADSLEAACADLVGQPINSLSTQPNDSSVSNEVVNESDCVSVAAMTQAIELRKDPVQCNFQPLLDPGTPRLCAKGESRDTFYKEAFGDRLKGWTVSSSAVFDPTQAIDWTTSDRLPGGRGGRAAFAAGPDAGTCSNGAGDISGVSLLTSPSINIPANQGALRLTFDHYIASEAGFDGGNVKISVNGGGFQLVPASAFVFNEYNTTLATQQQGSTNPLRGQAGFSGTDGGEVHGSWGQSQIDLSMVGVHPGDTVQLRFDFGRDGCGGNDGWYVDNVAMSTCLAGSGAAAVAREE